MYATHFDLDGRLFAPGIAQDDARFDVARGEESALPAEVALAAEDSVLVLLGPPGVGKTVCAAHTLRGAACGMRSAAAWLGMPPASPHELLELLLAEFGFEPYRQSRTERQQTWRQFLIELGATETRVFIALERAHEFDAAVLAALDALTTADPNGCPGASLILMGTDDLASRLEAPTLEPLRQRVRLVSRLHPLDADGVEGYLRHAVERAGGDFERLFTADALAALARHSRGIPRLLNHLADGALALAALRGAPVVDAERVDAVAARRANAVAERAGVDAAEGPGTAPAATEVESISRAPASSADDIPVLTESIEGEPNTDSADAAFETLDTAATMTLFDDELDKLSAEIAAEMLATDGAADRDGAAAAGRAEDASANGADAAEGVTGDAIDDARRRRKQRRRAAG